MRPILVVSFVALAACASAQTPKPETQPGRTDTQPASDPRGTNDSPFVVKIQPTPKTDEEAAKEQEKEQDDAYTKWWTQALAWFTAGLALVQLIAIGFQVRIASQQNKIIKGQTTILQGQETSMKDGLTVARDAAKAANKSADVAYQSMTGTQRAFLLLNRMNIRKHAINAPGELNRVIWSGFRITPQFQNSGQTPALDARARAFTQSFPFGTTAAAFAHPVAELNDESRNASLSVGIGLPIFANDVIVTDEQINQIIRGEIALFLYAIVEYRDFFEGTPVHETELCYRIMLSRDPRVGNQPRFSDAFQFRPEPADRNRAT